MRSAIDTNVISALLAKQQASEQAERLLLAALRMGGLVICGPVYSELLAVDKMTAAFLDSFLARTGIDVEFDLDEAVWREAGLAFQKYAHRRRRSGSGAVRRILADFLIGAHSIHRADRLVTFDVEGYRVDYPRLVLMDQQTARG